MNPMLLSIAALAVGALSACLYLLRRRWPDAALALMASVGLAALIAPQPGVLPARTFTLHTEEGRQSPPSTAESFVVEGHGLRAAEWHDLPARPIRWREPKAEMLWLQFPRTVALGRQFELMVRRADAEAGWRLQLLAENGRTLAEATARAPANELSLAWLPPVSEDMVLKARLLSASGSTIAEGPVPLRVTEPVRLQLRGRFAAPSFDLRVLSQLLADSGAVLDWQTQLGKSVARSELPSEPLSAPNGMIVDSAWFEGLGASARAALLDEVGEGMPLLVLGASAAQQQVWQRAVALKLAAGEKDDMRQVGNQQGRLAMPLAPLAPVGEGPWTSVAKDAEGRPWLWQRSWKKGRITWLGLSDWHRYAISQPAPLAYWWQSVLDIALRESSQERGWRFTDPMPVPGLRTELCADGFAAGTPVTVDGVAVPPLQRRPEKAGSVCTAVWPAKAGWMQVAADGQAAKLHVFGEADWPAWQRALRHDATALYAARSRSQPAPVREEKTGQLLQLARSLEAWMWAAIMAASMLALWWRERR
ncbi:hypothetical protein [Massilia endophytica]|uniref:hypothetical protein n=1 Tax=Massilia endophytica TaxID=2899220 RepID=UPI001E42998F|nr:hypothetical protein [Massilia endophytica]UGQ46689.1 hypothetical protein LSQ66_23475 [Massilia endophytica]